MTGRRIQGTGSGYRLLFTTFRVLIQGALLVLLQACTLESGGPGASLPALPGIDGGPPRFTPLAQRGAFLLSEQEAESLALQMSPRSQGIDSWQELAFPVRQSLDHISSRPAGATALSLPGLCVSRGRLAATLRHLQAVLPLLDKNPGLLARDFLWYRIGPDFGYTGYFEPTLQAARAKSPSFPYPLYRVPPDLRRETPYHTR
jgi:membrane-bound lytic murein transglycosylase A